MNAWASTRSGRIVEFHDPVIDREMILTDVAHGLAVQVRFTGQTEVPLSIAQHSVLVSDALLSETGDPELAAFGLLHDAHEFIFGDWPTPAVDAVMQAIDRRAAANGIRDLVREAFEVRLRDGIVTVKRTLDRAILAAAGLSHARFEAAHETIRLFDLRALRTERDDLMRRSGRPWALIEDLPRLKTKGRVRGQPWPDAEDRFKAAFLRLCPETKPAAAPTRASAA